MQTRHRGTVGTMKAETGDGSASQRAPDSQQTRRGRGRGREHGLPNSPQKEPTLLTPYSWTPASGTMRQERQHITVS